MIGFSIYNIFVFEFGWCKKFIESCSTVFGAKHGLRTNLLAINKNRTLVWIEKVFRLKWNDAVDDGFCLILAIIIGCWFGAHLFGLDWDEIGGEIDLDARLWCCIVWFSVTNLLFFFFFVCLILLQAHRLSFSQDQCDQSLKLFWYFTPHK